MKIKVLALKNNFVDGNGDIMPEDANVEFSEKIVLTKNFSLKPEDIVGEAKLVRQNNDFYIEDTKIYDDTVRQTILDAGLYPAIGGMIKKRDGEKVTDFTIDQVCFSVGPNTDPDIKPVKEQLMSQSKQVDNSDAVLTSDVIDNAVQKALDEFGVVE